MTEPTELQTNTRPKQFDDLSPHLVHQILLNGPGKDVAMAIDTTPFPSFDNFQETLLHGSTNDTSDQAATPASGASASAGASAAFVMKRAFHDNLLDAIDTQDNLSPIQQLLLELHQKLRGLVPNRIDLHHILNDHRPILAVSDTKVFLSWIVEAGRVLSYLESEVQSETTISWVHRAEQYCQQDEDEFIITTREQLSWMVCSLLYLLEKADRTQADKDAFYFNTIIIPQICSNGKGIQMERDAMENRFGSHLPITRDWIWSLIQNMDETKIKELRTNPQARMVLIAKGWIETLLFQSPSHQQEHGTTTTTTTASTTTMPEIFYLDVGTLRAIRNVARYAAAGCALGLHAAHMAKCSNSEVMALQKEITGRVALVKALRNRHEHPSSQEAFEQSVLDGVVTLTEEWKGCKCTGDEIGILEGQTKHVLSAQDPVLTLLNDRMQGIFCELAVASVYESDNDIMSHSTSNNAMISTQHHHHQQHKDGDERRSNFVKKAQTVFSTRGLALFAHDLADAAELAAKVPTLACWLYDDKIVAILGQYVEEQSSGDKTT